MNPISSSGMMPMAGMQPMSPQSAVEDKLSALVESGEISSTDESAISEALSDIGTELQSSAPEPGTPPPSKEEMDAKIDSLIEEQVSSGTLSESQAEDLSAMFDELQSQGETQGSRPPPPPPPSGSTSDSSDTDSVTSSSSSDIGQFLQMLAEQNSTSYGTNGTVQGEGSYLFNYSA
ncbi:hypothetical protein [Cohaesibacter celericrescens]|uniref:hypothetical protein n=1 Tax=Cohaesibacter celericrescens TaxID=2067669 RepID=UPI00356A5860